jgi:hypothetical protein
MIQRHCIENIPMGRILQICCEFLSIQRDPYIFFGKMLLYKAHALVPTRIEVILIVFVLHQIILVVTSNSR